MLGAGPRDDAGLAASSGASVAVSGAGELVTADFHGEGFGTVIDLAAQLAAAAERPSEHAAAAKHAPLYAEAADDASGAELGGTAECAAVSSDTSASGSEGASAGGADVDSKRAAATTPLRPTAGANVSSAESTRSNASSAQESAGSGDTTSVGALSVAAAADAWWLTDADDVAAIAGAAREHMKWRVEQFADSLLSSDLILECSPAALCSAFVRF